jgi:penicillin-binding protein 1A
MKDPFALPDGYGGISRDRQHAVPPGAHNIDTASGDWATSQTPPPFGSPETLPQPPKTRSRKWYWISRGIAAFLMLFILAIIWLAITAPMSKSLQPIVPPQLTLVSADGKPIARNGAIVDKPVKIAELPSHIKDAFLAIEDRRFYSHWGIDPRGLARAAWSNATGSSGTQGGSTITQQLAKFTFLTPERSMTRKAREMLIAFWLEAWLTKDQILERYLSNAYFGDNVYGLRAASLHYFNRPPEKLKLSQSAMLAGLVQAPSRLAPTKNYKLAAKRGRLVLKTMVVTKAITEAEFKATPDAKVNLGATDSLPTGTYFADWAMPQARELTEANYSNQTVKTTLDTRLQNIARNVIANAPLGPFGEKGTQVALVAMRPNGEVVAMVGGRSYKASPFNRASQAARQPGSTFKLFVYLAALRAGMTPDSKVDDSAITTGLYQPKNASDKYRGQISMRDAFASSSNVAAVRLYNQVGDRAVMRAARDLGIESTLTADPSLALGSSGVNLLELTAAFASIAGNNWPVEPRAFKAEEAGWFDWLWSPKRSLDSATHKNLLDLLSATVNNGTGRAARLSIPAYGKTGTSQDNRDALFVGFAGDLVVGVWIGKDDNTPLKGINGGGLPARIWHDFMVQAVKGARPAAKAKPKAPPKADPTGPIEPLDLPEIPENPINIGNSDVQIDPEKGVTVTTEVGGVPIDMTLGRDGFDIKPGEDRTNPQQ